MVIRASHNEGGGETDQDIEDGIQNSAKLRGRQHQKPCCISQGVMAALPHRAEFQTLQGNGDLLCTWCKGSCRRSFVAPVPRQQPSAACDWLSLPGLLIWQNSSVQLATRTMQVISNGDLHCSGNMGSCRRSFDAKVRRKQRFATNCWLLSFGPFHGSRCRVWQDHTVQLTVLTVHVISNGASSVMATRGRADGALMHQFGGSHTSLRAAG